jgi:hypothetical protein
MPGGKSGKPGRVRAANGPLERRDCSGIPISVSLAARVCSPCRSTTPSRVAPCGWSWCDKAKGANPGICLPLNLSRRRSKPGTSPSPTLVVGKSRNVSVFRTPHFRSNPSDFRTGSRGAKCSCWSRWPRDCCSGRSLHRSGLPVPPCLLGGANEPTGACGRQKFACIVCVGHSVGSGKCIPHAFRAGTPIVRALTLLGPSALYPGGPLFGTSADVCSKSLL